MIGEFSVNDMRNYVSEHIILSPQDPRFHLLGDDDLFVISYHEGNFIQ